MPSIQYYGVSELEGTINFITYKEGILVVYDCRNTKILDTSIDNIFGKTMDKMSKALANYRASQTMTEQQRQRLLRRAGKDDLLTVDVEHVHMDTIIVILVGQSAL